LQAFREHHGGVFYEPVVDPVASYPTRRTVSLSEEHVQSISSLISLTKSVSVIELTEKQVFRQESSANESTAVKPNIRLPADEFSAVKPGLQLPADKPTVVKSRIGSPVGEPSVVKSRSQIPAVEPSAGAPALNTNAHHELTAYEQFHKNSVNSTQFVAMHIKNGTRRNLKSSVSSSSAALSRPRTTVENSSLVVGSTIRSSSDARRQLHAARSQVTMETERTLTREQRRVAQAKIKQMEDKVWLVFSLLQSDLALQSCVVVRFVKMVVMLITS